MVERDVLGVDGEHDRVAHGVEAGKAVDEGVHHQLCGERLRQVAEFDLPGAAHLGEVGEELYGEAHEPSVSATQD